VINRFVIILLVLLMLPMFASAEIYKYRDQNGVLRFTDNLTEVPIAQRKNIEHYKEVKTAPATNEAPVQDPKAIEKELTDEKGLLDNEYSQLEEMRNRLEAGTEPGTPEEIAAYKQNVKEYNAQLKIYEVKLKAFREKLEAYQKAAE